MVESTRERIDELEQQRKDLDQTLRELRELQAEVEAMMRKRGAAADQGS